MIQLDVFVDKIEIDRPSDKEICEAISFAMRFSQIDGEHHKMWVINQMLRKLLGNKYEIFLSMMNSDEDYKQWDIGIAP